MRWSSGPVNVVDAERDTTYVFPKEGTGGTLTVAFMNCIVKRFLRTLVGAQGHPMMPWITYGNISHLGHL